MLGVLLAAVVQSPDLSKPIALRTVAKPVSEVLRDVSGQAGFTFGANQVRDWPVIVSVKDLPVGQVLDRIAEVTDSEWVKERDRWVLTRSAARVKKAVEIELEDRAARLKPVVDALPTEMTDADIEAAAAEIKKTILEEEGSGLKTVMSGTSAANILLNASLKRLPISEIAAAPISSFVSYASDPRPGQRRLPAFSPATWKDYFAARAKFAKVIDLPPDVQVSAGLSSLSLPSQYQIILGFSRPFASAGINVWLGLFGSDGKILDLARASLTMTPARIETSPPPSESPVSVSDAGKRLIHVLQPSRTLPGPSFTTQLGDVLPVGAPDPWTASENVAVARAATLREPLSYAISDWVLDLADQSGKGIVAHIPDFAFNPLHQRLATTIQHDVLWKALPDLGIQAKADSNLLTLKPSMFARADRYRVDRGALRKLVAAGGQYGRPSLGALLDYVGSSPRVTYHENLDIKLLGLVFRRAFANFIGFQDQVDALRLLRAFRAEDRTSDRLTLGQALSRFSGPYDAMLRSFYASRSGGGTHRSSLPELPKVSEFDPFAGAAPDPQTPVIMDLAHSFNGVLAVFEGDHAVGLTPLGVGTFLGLRPENISGFTPILKFKRLHPARVVRHSLMFRAGSTGSSFEVEDVAYRPEVSWTVDQTPAEWKDQIEEGRKNGALVRMSVGPLPPP
jgi:hypothetical protein